MINIKFQPALDILFNKSIDDFPGTLMLIGQEGCGKHTFINNIAEKYKLDLINITDNIDKEYLDNLRFQVRPSIYYIDSNLSIKEQNELLKFIEEPLKNSFIIILTESKNIYLETIHNRCINFEFNTYSKTQLESFMDDNIVEADKLLSYVKTPGQIDKYRYFRFSELESLCSKIILQIGKANTGNIFKIHNHVANLCKIDNVVDYKIFATILLIMCSETFIKFAEKKYIGMYLLISEYKSNLLNKHLNREYLLDNLLLNLKEVSNDRA